MCLEAPKLAKHQYPSYQSLVEYLSNWPVEENNVVYAEDLLKFLIGLSLYLEQHETELEEDESVVLTYVNRLHPYLFCEDYRIRTYSFRGLRYFMTNSRKLTHYLKLSIDVLCVR